VRRPRAILAFALALIGGMLAVGAWLRGPRRPAAHVIEAGSATSTQAPAVPGASPPATLGPSAPPRPGPVAPGAGPASEEELLAEVRADVRRDPREAESLAREARARFPSSPHADEWDALLVDALVNQQRIGAARSETYYYYDHHPEGAFAAHLFALTGVHPVPAGPGPH
jgi:hypothetical protein